MISEVKPKNFSRTLQEVEYKLKGYEFISKNMDSGTGRGLCIYIRNGIEYKEVVFKTKFSEYLAVEINVNKNEVLLAVNVYRSPSSDNVNNVKLNDLIREIADSDRYSYLAFAGDINYGNIDWAHNYCRSQKEDSKEFLFMESVRDAFFTQHVEGPTRGRGNDTPSTLDLLLTRGDDIVEDLTIESPLGKSDHAVIRAKLVCNFQGMPITKTRFQYDKADFNKMKDLLTLDWKSVLEEDFNTGNVDNMWVIFRNKITEAIDTCVPKRTVTINGKNSNKRGNKLDRKALSKIKRKNRLWDNYCKTSDGQVYLEYCKVRNQVRSLTRKTEKLLEKSVAQEAKRNPKKFWQFVGNKTKKKVNLPDLLIEDDVGNVSGGKTGSRYTANDQEKANVFNGFFASVFNQKDTLYNKVIPERTENKILEVIIDEDLVRKQLKKLKICKSPGPDGIHPRVLKEIMDVIITPLTLIYTASTQHGRLPEDWKSANVTAIYKKGNRHIAGNYRPVSLTSIACKMLESIVREQIIGHMKKNKLFSKKQFGFLSGRSTILQLLRVMDEWTSILDRGGAVDVVYFDFMKAFDKVCHGRLLMKLGSYGIGGTLQEWIKSFLTGRKQRVVVNGTSSEWAEVTSGVPQGSVLGPLLFVVFINDLPEVVDEKSSLYMFADDTKLFREISSTADSDVLQTDIDCMDDWSDDWQMQYHPNKCHVMKLGKHPTELGDLFNRYELSGQPLDTVEYEKDLGVIMDVKLSFEKHVSEKVSTANKVLGVIRRCFTFLDANMMIMLYKAMVRPHLEYANQVWAPRLLKHVDMLENVQDRATKMIPGINKGLKPKTYEARLRKLKLPTLTYRRLRGDLIETYKILTGKYDPEVCEGFIKLREEAQEAGTRGNSLKIFKERFRLDIKKYSFPHRVIDIWNDIPDTVVAARTVEVFERRLDKFMSSQDMYYDYRAKYIKKYNSDDTGRPKSGLDTMDLVQEAL